MQKWTINEKGTLSGLCVRISIGIVRENGPKGLTHISFSIYVHWLYVYFPSSIPWKRGYGRSGGRKTPVSFGEPSCASLLT